MNVFPIFTVAPRLLRAARLLISFVLVSLCSRDVCGASLISKGPVIDLANLGTAPNAYFGSAAAIENDTAVAVGLKPGGFGFVRTYQRSGATWALGSQLELLAGSSTQGFGAAVSLSGDVIAVLSRPSTVTTAITLFARTGTAWRLEQTITQSNWPISGGYQHGVVW